MVSRLLSFFLGATALVLFSSGSLLASDKEKGTSTKANTHEGRVVSAENNQLVMTDKSGKEHTHKITDDTKILIKGRTAKLEDLKPGMRIMVTTLQDDQKTASRIEVRNAKVKASDQQRNDK